MLRKERLTLHIRISAGDYCVLYFSYGEEMRMYVVFQDSVTDEPNKGYH